MEKDIYDLVLHEATIIKHNVSGVNAASSTVVTRVPGGWIYSFSSTKTSAIGSNPAVATSAVFVPHNTEFDKNATPKE